MPDIVDVYRGEELVFEGPTWKFFAKLKDGSEVALSHPHESYELRQLEEQGVLAGEIQRYLGCRSSSGEVGFFSDVMDTDVVWMEDFPSIGLRVEETGMVT